MNMNENSRLKVHPNLLLLTLGAAAIVGSLAQLTIAPNLANIAKEYSVSLAVAAVTLSIFSVMQAIAQAFYGPLADRFAPQKLLLYSLIIFGISTVGVILSPSFEILVILRAVQAITATAGIVISTVLAATWFQQKDRTRAMATIQIAGSLGAATGLVNGSVVGSFMGWHYAFITPAFVSVLSIMILLIVISKKVSSSPDTQDSVKRTPGSKLLVANSSTLTVSVISSSQYFGVFTFQAILPILYDQRTAVPSWTIGFLMAMIPISVMVGSWIGGRFTPQHDRRSFILRSVVGAVLGCAIVSLSLGISNQSLLVAALVLAEVVLGVFIGLGIPGQLALIVEHFPGRQGAVSSIFYLSRSLGMFAGPIVGGFLVDISGFSTAFLAAAILNFLVYLVSIRFVKDVHVPIVKQFALDS